MPSDRELRLLALAEAQGPRPLPIAVAEPTVRETQPGELTVSVRVAQAGEPNDNGDIYPEDQLLHQVMMHGAREAIGAVEPGQDVQFTLPEDSTAARLIREGHIRHVLIREGHIRHVSMGSEQPRISDASIEADPTLTDLFMNREAQEAAATLGVDPSVPDLSPSAAADGSHISFDSDDFIEGRTSPNEAVRFQVGRQSPPPTSFSRDIHAGPSEGRVVSRRGADGNFQVVQRPQRRDLAPHDPVRRHDPVRDGSRPVRQSQGRMVPAPPPAKVRNPPPPPTRYERLLGPDPFDD
jgi:hypothetical protein